MALVRKLFGAVILLCLILPLCVLISYHEPEFVHVPRVNWMGPAAAVQHASRPPSNATVAVRGGNHLLSGAKSDQRRLNNGVLVICRTLASRPARLVQYQLLAQRVKLTMYATSSAAPPDLVQVEGPMSIGRYSLLVVMGVAIVSDHTLHQLFEEYCALFGASMIYITTKGPAHNIHRININPFSTKYFVQYLSIIETEDFKYLRNGGEFHWKRNISKLVTFEALTGRHDDSNTDIQELINVHYITKVSSESGNSCVAMIDWNTREKGGCVRGFLGLPPDTNLGKLALLEMMQLIGDRRGSGVLRYGNRRYVQIDVDDVFFAPPGYNPIVPDIRELISTQLVFQNYLKGFKFNLGYCGTHYHDDADSPEQRGMRELVKSAHLFNWFDHTYTHLQPHKLTPAALQEAMQKNKQFALERGIPLSRTQYSVSPHHSGVYPIYEPLYKAWREVWNISVTSTEEYPHFKPPNKRRGFIHSGIRVLPRQTCGVYTHTNKFTDVSGGKTGLTAIAEEGEVLNAILNNPVSIFMTHYNNYGSDRLALELFKTAFSFLKQWTKLDLVYDQPPQLAEYYFKMFPEDRVPLWSSPCSDKRHLDIWRGSNCSRLPSVFIVGPQKTGSTALQFFLHQNPSLVTNPPTKHAFEEVQFFSSDYYYSNGIEWYMSFFPSADKSKILFEKSATYFSHPATPLRLHTLNPHARVIVILGDPVKRAYSWYQHMRSHNDHSALNYNFSQVIAARKELGSPAALVNLRTHCLVPGLYYQHLQKWLEYFPLKQIHFVDGDELVEDPFTALRQIDMFLKLPPFDYQNVLRFSARKGFYCVRIPTGKEACLGIGKGRHYPSLSPSCTQSLGGYYAHPNRMLYKLLLGNGRKPPTWLIKGFSK